MGCGATNVVARVGASLGALTAVAPQFQPALDVPYGGVLCALPALLAVGLLDGNDDALGALPEGYYGQDSLLMLLAFMAMGRLKSIESLRYKPPGEWGKLLGLDRAPEVRTLRDKIQILSADGQAAKWSGQLCQRWMQTEPEQAGVLLVDGHTRVYHGSQTKLPRHYVARQKLCLRATVDFWVNAMDGQPFFVINKVVDEGLISAIETDILPRLEQDVPNQPDENALAANPYLHRFTLVFDREAYSPDFFLRLKAKRIAVLSYHKFPGEDWADEEFSPHQMTLASGQVVTLQLAERGTCMSNGLWVRKVRKMTQRAHQTSIIATDYLSDLTRLAANMMARWSQENYFKYAREHYGLDQLAGYCIEEIPDPIRVVNPANRALAAQVRSLSAKRSRCMALFGALNLDDAIEPPVVAAFTAKKVAIKEEVDALGAQLVDLKARRKATPTHIKVSDLPEEQRFKQLSTHSKHFIDAIKMIAYRAETAMANALRESLRRADEARTLLRALYTNEADLLPDHQNKTLTVRLHHLANQSADQAIRLLCDELNQTETLFPRTDLRMVFEVGRSTVT